MRAVLRAPALLRRGAVVARRLLRSAAGRAGAVGVGLLVALAGVLAASGGLAAAGPRALPTVGAGEPVDLGEVRVAVLDQAVTDDVAPASLEGEGAAAWLLVRVRVEAAGDRTLTALPDMLALPDGVALTAQANRCLLTSDGTFGPQVHPGLAAEIACLWPVADPGDVPEDLVVELLRAEQYFSPFQQRDVWGDPEPAARAVVPRTASVPAALVEEDL